LPCPFLYAALPHYYAHPIRRLNQELKLAACQVQGTEIFAGTTKARDAVEANDDWEDLFAVVVTNSVQLYDIILMIDLA
jgi:hypothetical protein